MRAAAGKRTSKRGSKYIRKRKKRGRRSLLLRRWQVTKGSCFPRASLPQTGRRFARQNHVLETTRICRFCCAEPRT